MPHLHLPASHGREDIALAHRVAESFSAGDLYVAWSHREGPGQRPAVHACVRRPPAPLAAALSTALGWLAEGLERLAPAPHPRRRRPGTGATRVPAR